jgi:DNA polymerase-3 subunit epsilon
MLNTLTPSQPTVVSLAARIIAQKPVYIDTETTGLDKNGEIVEISILDSDGSVLLNSLVKSSKSIPLDVQVIHGITNNMVSGSLALPILWPRVRNLVFGRAIAAYNAPFDLKMIQQSLAIYRIPWRENFEFVDVMKLFSDYRGIWDSARNSMKMFKLEDVGLFFNIHLPNTHRSTNDALLTRAVIHNIAGLPY